MEDAEFNYLIAKSKDKKEEARIYLKNVLKYVIPLLAREIKVKIKEPWVGDADPKVMVRRVVAMLMNPTLKEEKSRYCTTLNTAL